MAESVILEVLVFFAPMYVANMFPVIGSKIKFVKFLFKPLDFGKKIGNNRILGDNKTFGGFLFGIIGGVLVGLLEMYLDLKYSWLRDRYVLFGAVSGFGAMFGDSFKSFLKRRIGFVAGHPLFMFDQLDFVLIGSLILYFSGFDPGWGVVLIGLLITPPLHLMANVLAYALKLKKVWW